MEQVTETFVIDNDKKADWAVAQIASMEAERDRLIKLAEEKIEDLKKRIDDTNSYCEHETARLKSLLYEYFRMIKPKETETQKSYQLLAGKLVFKKPSVKINHDDEQLIKDLEGTEFVETKKSLRWGEYKKVLKVDGENVIDTETGEIITACTVEEVPGKFEVKVKEEK